MRRWVRYEAPIMVCVDNISLARDHQGHFLAYDDTMQRIEDTDQPAEGRAITIAEYRDRPPPLGRRPRRPALPRPLRPHRHQGRRPRRGRRGRRG